MGKKIVSITDKTLIWFGERAVYTNAIAYFKDKCMPWNELQILIFKKCIFKLLNDN